MKRKITVLLVLLLLLSMAPVEVFAVSGEDNSQTEATQSMLDISAYDAENELESVLPQEYSNEINEIVPVYGKRKTSFLGKTADGGYQTVIYYDRTLYINNYDSSWNLAGSKQLELELPLWGGVLLGEKYNYVVCGCSYDSEQEDGGEVYRVIKYDKNFERIASVSISSDDSFTATPFWSGNVSIDESGNMLTVYTSRERMDGHQSNIALRINTDDMSIADRYGMVSLPDVHVSHSFRQIVRYDGDAAVYVDLSDGYPVRSVYIQGEKCRVPMLELPGESGHNITNAEVSGLEISDTHYMVVGTYLNAFENNVYLSAVNKETGEAETKWITSSSAFNPEDIYAPRITQITENRFVVMWNCGKKDSVQYIIVDQQGKAVCAVKEISGTKLTDCEPIYSNGEIIWLSVRNGILETETLNDFEEEGIFEWKPPFTEAVDPWDGTADSTWYDDSENVFYLSTPMQLAGLSELTAQGVSFAGKTVHLVNDVFMNSNELVHDWPAIQNWDGTFHGNGHTVYNVYQEDEGGGFFDVICESGIVKAVTFAQGMFYQGGCVADENRGIIAFCINRSMVYSDEYSMRLADGGICDSNYNLVYGCQNRGTVHGESVGGIVGVNYEAMSVVSQCSNFGTVRGIHSVGGIIGHNYGWVYNCYSKGFLTDSIPDNLNKARTVAGIAAGQGGYPAGDIESCYAMNEVLVSEAQWVYAIAEAGIVNGYSNFGNWDDSEDITMFAISEMRDASFVDLLNRQTNTMLPAWVADTSSINNGCPITVADYNRENGVYKIQPELWIKWSGTVTVTEGRTESISCNAYYNEAPITVKVKNPDIAKATLSKNTLSVTGLKEGKTKLLIQFPETENVSAAEYAITISVRNRYSCGDNITWSYDEAAAQLTLRGKGEMFDYPYDDRVPWYEYQDKIKTVVVSDGITTIGDYAFYGLERLDEVILPDSVISIGESAYASCSGIDKIVFSENLKEIGSCAFSYSCDWMYDLNLPDSLQYIGDSAFHGCTRLTDIHFPENLISIGDSAFYRTRVEKVIFSEKLESIGERAFDGCSKLKEIFFEGDAPEIGNNAFLEVTGQVFYPANNTTWTDDIKQNYGGVISWEPHNGIEEMVTPLEITKQPKSVYTKLGSTSKFTVEAEGDGLTYQWYYKSPGSTKFKKCSGTKPTYSLKMTEARSGRQLYCIVTDKYGNSVKTGIVTMRMAASIKTQPTTSYTRLGKKAKFTVEALGDGLKYQWYYQNEGSSQIKKCAGTSETYTLTMTEARRNRKLYCMVTDKYGNSVKTETVTMRMAASIKTQPTTSYTQLGKKVKFTVEALGDGLKYQWYYQNEGSSKIKKCAGTSKTYTLTMTEARRNRKLYCMVTDKYGNSVKTETVTMKMAASIKTQPKNVTAEKGKKAKLTVKAVGDDLKYQWYYKDTEGKKYKKAACTKDTYSIKLTKAREGRKFYCVVTDKYGNTVQTETVTVGIKK